MLPQRRRSAVRRIVRRTLLVGGIVLLLGSGVGAWWAWYHGADRLEHEVRVRIARMIDEASVPGYSFSMDSLIVDVRSGHLEATNVVLDFEPGLQDSLRAGAFRYLFAARAGRIELRGFSLWRLLVRGEFRVGAFLVEDPQLTYYIGGERVALTDPFRRLDQGVGPSISLVRADTLVVRDAVARVEDLGGDLPVLDLAGLQVSCRDVQITMNQRRGGVRLVLGDADLRLDSLETVFPDGDRLGMGEVWLSRSRAAGRVRNFRVVPDRSDSADAGRMRKPLVDAAVDSLVLSGIDVDRLIAEQSLRIGHLALHGARLEVELDKTLPSGEAVQRPLPPAALLGLPFTVRIDTLSVFDAEAMYDERDGATRRWGVVPFTAVQGRFLQVTNDPEVIARNRMLVGEISGQVFDSAHFTGRYEAELDGSQRFSFQAIVGDMPLVRLNSATRPLLRVQVNGGRLHRLELRMDGNDRRARGSVAVHYSDLLVRVEPGTPSELRHSMFGSVIETMLKEAYGGGLSADRERSFSIDRDPNRSLITYIWHALREGLARNLAPEAWERMRSMLRADAEQRRGQREFRRQRRQERQERR